MSRKIDFSKPLSEEDEAYVADRPWLRTDAELSGFDLSEETDFSVDGEDEDESGTPEGFENEDEESEDENDEDEESEEDDEEQEEDLPYSEWEFADLQAELKKRDLSAKGSKEQLAARLEQHDADNAE
ncbi:hypothetical protein SEA_AESIR_18 [Microbacterium phage Aesir]|nr:hypothetical protein SEA_AESIR_18 [Microbacterium phage Aesir]WNM69094.1 hypothetical protein SEA_ERUDITE_18 [Microbacterium phage Erudite]